MQDSWLELVLFIPIAKGKTCDCYQVIKMTLECRNWADKQIMRHHCCCWCWTFYSLVPQLNLIQVSQCDVVGTSICLYHFVPDSPLYFSHGHPNWWYLCEFIWMLFVSCALIKATVTRKHHHLSRIDITAHVFLFLTLFPELKEWIELISADGWIGTFHYTESVMFAEITSQAY